MKKNKHAARLWEQRWSFFSKIGEIEEEEALNAGNFIAFYIHDDQFL